MNNDIGSTIREMRKAAGMSQSRLAGKVGVSYQQIQKYEKGASKLSVPRLLQIAECFGVPFTALVGEAPVGKGSTVVIGSNFTPDEAKVIVLYRRLKRKGIKFALVKFLEDMVKVAEAR